MAFRYFFVYLGILCALVSFSSAWAAGYQVCTFQEITRLARGGFTDQEIQSFCVSEKDLPIGKHVKQRCVPSTIAKFARGGFSDTEINEFCLSADELSQEVPDTQLTQLEGKGWITHYFLSNQRKRREVVTFSTDAGKIIIQSSNPRVSYYDITHLGNAIQFKRKQTPYKAIYDITIEMAQVTGNQLTMSQKYKRTTTHIWKAN